MTLYGPNSMVTIELCELLERELPGIKFGFTVETEGLRMSGRFNSRYYERLLRDQAPADVVSEFRDRLHYQSLTN